MAQRLWPGQNAVGKCLRFVRRDAPCHTVTGIVENARQNNVIEPEPVPLFYLPLGDGSGSMRYGTTIIVRTRPDAERAARAELLGGLATAFPGRTPAVQSMLEALDGEYWPWQLGARLFTAFGLLALLVAMIGIYSTVSYTVTQRFHEFGVRAALGARVGDLLRQVVGEGTRVAFLGVVVGTALTLAAGRLIASMLYDVKPSDPLTLLAVGGVLLGVAVAAALVPAWRAARVDPVIALRSD
jgi:putative ABC transport system permease protein